MKNKTLEKLSFFHPQNLRVSESLLQFNYSVSTFNLFLEFIEGKYSNSNPEAVLK